MTDRMNPDEQRDLEKVRKSRNTMLGLLLGAFVVLVFFISLARIGG